MPTPANPNPMTYTKDNQARRGSDLLSQAELAVAISVHPMTISRWTVAGIIPCHRVGRIVRYDLAAVLAAIEKAAKKQEGDK